MPYFLAIVWMSSIFCFKLLYCVEKVKHSAQCRSVFNTSITKQIPFSSYTLVPCFSASWKVGLHRIKTLVCKCGTACKVCWRFAEWSCPSYFLCHDLLLPWCYRHENLHVKSSPTMTSLWRHQWRPFSGRLVAAFLH